MFAPAPAIIRGFHLTALHNAYGLMAAAAETGKPHACWAHHKTVGGAKVADQLVALGYFTRRLDAKPGQVDTFFYRITREGCAYISQPYLVEESMSDPTPAPDVDQTPPAEPVDLSYPPKAPAPDLKIVEPAPAEDPERLRIQASDLLFNLTPAETALLAAFTPGERRKVPFSTTRTELTKKGLITLLYRRGLYEDPFMQLTPLGEAAAALNAEMRVPSDDEAPVEFCPPADEEEDGTVDEDALRQRFTFKRGDRVRYGDAVGTVDSTDIYPFVLFESDASVGKLIKVSEFALFRIEESHEETDPTPEEIESMLTLEVIDETLDTKEIPAVELTDAPDPAAEIAELRADRAALIDYQIETDKQISDLRAQLAAVKSALVDDDGALPDDPAAAILALKLHVVDQQHTVTGLAHTCDVLQEKCAVLEQERDIMKRDVTGLKLQIAAIANSGEMGVQHDWTHKTTPADITARTLAGWTPWHKEMTADGLFVVWERKPDQKPARRSRERTQVTGPAAAPYIPPSPRPVTPGVLQPDAVIIPAETEPAYASSAPRSVVIGGEPEPLNPMSTVLASFTRNLHAQFEANPAPSYSDRPTR